MIPATKERIIESAIKVFNEDLSAPLQKVADNADVTRRTLHRYFKDRNELVSVCEKTMEISCKKAMIAAIHSSDESIKQLENMLYAGIDCGAKYSFFYKLHQKKEHHHSETDKNCADYDYIYRHFNHIIKELQQKGKVNAYMSTEWIQILHSGIIEGTVNARDTTDNSIAEIKGMAWISFLKAISV